MSEINVEVDILTVCRICLQHSDEETLSIYDRDTSDESMRLYEKIEKCGGIKVLADPELPSRICKKCNLFLTIAHKFRVICQNSDDYLREFVSKPKRRYNDHEDVRVEYLVEETNDATNSANNEEIKEEPEYIGSNQEGGYEELDRYTEAWLNEDDLIEEVHDESPQTDDKSPSPAKTLGITADGDAFIQDVSPKRRRTKKKPPQICDICGNTYPNKSTLEAHLRRHRDEKIYKCEICQMSFHISFQLTRHMRKHTGERPYCCEYCKRCFSDRSTLVKHERVHRNERPYTCKTCNKSFTRAGVLKVHQQIHTGEKPYSCGICGKRFAVARRLRQHLETLLHQNDPRAKVLLRQIKNQPTTESNDEFISMSP